MKQLKPMNPLKLTGKSTQVMTNTISTYSMKGTASAAFDSPDSSSSAAIELLLSAMFAQSLVLPHPTLIPTPRACDPRSTAPYPPRPLPWFHRLVITLACLR